MPVSTFNFQFLISQWSIGGRRCYFSFPLFFKLFSLFENLASSDGWAGLTHLLLFYFLFMRNGKGGFYDSCPFFLSLGYSRFVYKQCLNNESAYPGFFFFLFLYLVVLAVLVSLDCIALIKTTVIGHKSFHAPTCMYINNYNSRLSCRDCPHCVHTYEPCYSFMS